MNLKDILTPDVVALEIKSSKKEDIINELIDILVDSGKIEDKESALEAVITREKQMSTGIQTGVAIPHGKVKGLKNLTACIAICKEGINFEALDGQPSQIFVLTLSPAEKTGPHVQFLAEISRLLTRPEIRAEILSASTKEEIISSFLQ